MDNNAIEGLLIYEPPWRGQLIKWREKRKTLLSSVAFAAAPLEVEPGQDIGGERWMRERERERERERGREGKRVRLKGHKRTPFFLQLPSLIWREIN